MNSIQHQQGSSRFNNQSNHPSQLTKQLDSKQAQKLPRKQLLFGDKLYKAGQDAELLYMVNQGFIKTVVHSVMGKDRIVDIYGPGEIVGSAALENTTLESSAIENTVLERSVHSETVQAISSCSLTPIDPEYALLNTAFSRYLSTALAKQVCRHRESIDDAALPVGARLCRLLIRLSDRFGERNFEESELKESGSEQFSSKETSNVDYMRLPFTLTQEEFAARIGSSRITVSRIFSHLKTTGAIVKTSSKRSSSFVLNVERLELALDTYVLDVL